MVQIRQLESKYRLAHINLPRDRLAFQRTHELLVSNDFREHPTNLLNRIKTEKLAGKLAFDVVYGAAVPLMPTLGVVKPYLSAEAKAFDPRR